MDTDNTLDGFAEALDVGLRVERIGVPAAKLNARAEARALHAADTLSALRAAAPPDSAEIDFPDRVARNWAANDLADLRAIRDPEERKLLLNQIHQNTEASSSYDKGLQAAHPTAYAEVQKEAKAEARRMAAKEARKSVDAVKMSGLIESVKTTSSAPSAAAIAAREHSLREETRARLEAFANGNRLEAEAKYPDLKNAFALQAASNAFRQQHIRDAQQSRQFQDMTNRYIEQKIIDREPIKDILDSPSKKLAKDPKKDRGTTRQTEQDLSR